MGKQNNELHHSGIKGMRWGVRRYQNEDGTLTPEGKKRYDKETSGLSDAKKAKHKPDPDKWVSNDIRNTKSLVDESSGLVNKVKTANSNAMQNTKRAKIDLSNMTDQQMRNEINRALLERQYTEMFAPKKVSKGREVVGKILEVAGTVLGIGSSALGIALAIKELRS